MATPAYKKKARQEAHRVIRRERARELLTRPNPAYIEEFKEYVPSNTYRRETRTIQSLSESKPVINEQPKEKLEYSGDYVVGIATMHKSNLVPVGRGDSPEDYAKMRRN